MNAKQIKDEIRQLSRIDKIEIYRWIDEEAAADLLSRIGVRRNRTKVQSDRPSETAPVRKVVQISIMVHPDKDWAFFALCDDGSLWLYHGSWLRIENMPQTTNL
jgi:hypothetical protein